MGSDRSESGESDLPVATQWVHDALATQDRTIVNACFMVVCPTTAMKGSSFALESGIIVTNEHVIRGETAQRIGLIGADGIARTVSHLVTDARRDLAFLTPTEDLGDAGMALATDDVEIGASVRTWGYPLGYNGPAPLLIQGTIAGFNVIERLGGLRRIIVNAAFNGGNSGGPLLRVEESSVVGVVVATHAPISEFHLSALEALKNARSGLQFTASDGSGNTRSFSEAQLVGDLLEYYRSLTQVVIGEAIHSSEVQASLDEAGLA